MKSNVRMERCDKRNLQRQGLMGLLLLTLLVANPFQALGQGVLNTSTDTGVYLNGSFGPTIHTVTVTPGITIDNTFSGNNAISGDSRPWHLINNGTLNGLYEGVYFTKGGSVDNSASIFGYDNGVYITGDSGSVVNSGSIEGYNYDGIYFDHGGSVNNLSGGYILGEGYNVDNGAGVEIYGGAGLVNNAGTIESYNGLDGVYLDQGGSVSNSGSIYGNGSGVEIYGGPGSVVNNGDIYGYDGNGVYVDQSGSVSNSGGIYGYNSGVAIGGQGYVVNNGFIAGGYDEGSVGINHVADGSDESLAGVYLGGGGVVVNSGTIIGAYDYGTGDGVYIDGGLGFVTNSGIIFGNGDDGVELNVGGVVNNLAGGLIGGGINGVDINGPAVVINAGTIVGEGDAGVYLNQGGSVSNTGSIYGNLNGVEVYGNPGIVYNYGGSIIGTNHDGVYMDQGGTVVNKRTWSWENGVSVPSIEGGVNGVEISGGAGFVTNSGSITGDTGAGVKLNNGGGVDNKKHGFIGGNTDGVVITNGWGYVMNTGVIIGTNNVGVHLRDGGVVVNQTRQSRGNYSGYDNTTASANDSTTYASSDRGIIQGGTYGVEIYGDTGYVTNSGSISGEGNDGVRLWDGGLVVNQSQGNNWDGYGNTPTYYNGNNNPTIAGNTGGVKISGGEGLVINSGTIWGTNNDGVYLGSGGSVYNQYNGTISGGNNGVTITGDSGYVYNDGDISGAPAIPPPGSVISSAKIIQAPIGGNGVYLGLGGSVYNQYNGTIEGNFNGVEITGGTGYVSNDGDISGGLNSVESSSKSIALVSGSGVSLGLGGTVINGSSGSIEGYNGFGVYISGGPGVVVNSGYIYGNNGTAIQLATGFSNSVTLMSYSDVVGNIVGGVNGTDSAFLQGYGEYDYNFVNFATLTAQGSDWGNGWTLGGTQSFSTNVTVESGTLRITGNLTAPVVTVNEGATLAGPGTINGAVTINGTINPGDPVTLNINGSLNMANAIYNEQVDASSNSDLINVSGSPGTAIISNATVNVELLDRKIYASQITYTNLIASGGVLGTNAGANLTTAFPASPQLFLSVALVYPDSNTVLTVLSRKQFVTVAATYNQAAAASGLDSIVDSMNPGTSNLVNEFFWLPSAGAARAALDSLSGEIHGTIGMLDVQQQGDFNRSIAQRTGRMSANGGNSGFASNTKPVQLTSAGSTLPPMQQVDANQPLDIWLQGFGSFGNLDDDGNALGGNYTVSGMSGGLDYRLSPQMLVGLALGYSHDNADVGGPGANAKVDAFQIGGYGGYVNGPWHLDGILSYGFLQTDTKRFINVGSIQQEADGSYDGGVFSVSAEGGYAFDFDWLSIEPTIGLDYAHLWQDGFSETGIATDGHNYGLNVGNVNMDSVRSALGLRLAAQFGKKDGVQFIPALRAAWEHEFADRYANLNASFVGGSGSFNVRGVELGADSGVLGGGLTVAFNKTIQGFVNYDASLNSKLNSSTVSGGLSVSW